MERVSFDCEECGGHGTRTVRLREMFSDPELFVRRVTNDLYEVICAACDGTGRAPLWKVALKAFIEGVQSVLRRAKAAIGSHRGEDLRGRRKARS